ncbi:MAG: hypothetical protein ABSE43_04205 [Steroidobacteraceae bacterium]|jgi:hypothetical protein
MVGSRLPMLAVLTLLLLLFWQIGGADPLQTHSAYEAARSQITLTFDQQRTACDALSEGHSNLCIVEAQATANRSRAEATVNYLGTNRSRINSQRVNIRADFAVARARCATQSGTAQSECINLAQATRDRLLGEIRTVQQAGAISRRESAETPGAAQETVDLSQCDALIGTDRDTCMASVHATLGQ